MRERLSCAAVLPDVKRGGGAWGLEGRIPEVTMVGTELVMELGGASIPDACRGRRGGGGPGGRQDGRQDSLLQRFSLS